MTNKLILKREVEEYVKVNSFEATSITKSRCIDGRYVRDGSLPATTFPGADAGAVALVFATCNRYGFELHTHKLFETFSKFVGGEKYLSFHTDEHADKDKPFGGCGHMKQIELYNEAYFIEKENYHEIYKYFSHALDSGARQDILTGSHNERAVIVVSGEPRGVYSQGEYEFEGITRHGEFFIYQKELSDMRNKKLAEALLDDKAITLFGSQDKGTLYDAFLDIGEVHVMETVSRLAKNLPVFQIVFSDQSNFEVTEL